LEDKLTESSKTPTEQSDRPARTCIDAIIHHVLSGLSRERKDAISSIIIDGYNLIGIDHHDLNRQREQLIQSLIDYKKIRGHDITVVFDGWKSGSGREEQFTTGGVRVIYSRLGEKADAVIKRIISREKKEWIAITSTGKSCPYLGQWFSADLLVRIPVHTEKVRYIHVGRIRSDRRRLRRRPAEKR
jgi:hypothetical protein